MEMSRARDGERFFHVKEITVRFGGIIALKRVNLGIAPNEIRGVIGPNGAGKTTLFSAITRYVPIESGAVFYRGEDITDLKSHEIANKGIIRTFQKRGIIGNLTALENVLTGCHRLMHDLSLWSICFRSKRFTAVEGEGIQKAREALDAVGLSDIADQNARELSFGQQTLVEIARALVSKPQILLLDEPAAGLSAREREQLIDILRTLPRDHGVSLIITDHIMDFVMRICENLTVLNFGEVLEEGSASYIRQHPEVLKAYFGKG